MNGDIEKLLQDRYFLKSEKSWVDIAKRISRIYPDIYAHILNMEFIPSSPTLMNLNTNGERIGTLSSCFPMGIDDSIEGIFESLKECGIVTKYGGGVGYNFGNLRSSDEDVNGIGGRKSSGPLAFISIFNESLNSVSQGGARRGAGSAQNPIYHGDILDFINAKKERGKFERFNFSVRIPNNFYSILKKTPNKIHRIKDKDGNYSDLIINGDEKITVKEVWNIIIENAWENAEPGIFNEDLAFDRCTVTNVDKNVLGNPCFEFISIPYSSCNLGSINLSKLIIDNNGKLEFDWEKFEDLIVKAIRYLNNIIDNNVFPIEKIKDITNKIRPIGLGLMGLSHLFYRLKIPYNSKEAIDLSKEITKYMTLKGLQESVELAKKSGAYEAFDHDLFINANKRFFNRKSYKNIDIEQLKKDIKKYGIRNSGVTSIAPTGTLSTIAETSGGIEPVFALIYNRKIEKINKIYEVIPIIDVEFKKYLKENFDEDQINKIIEKVINNNGSCQSINEIPEKMQKVFVIANDIAPLEHLDIMEVVANNVSYSVSKTINLPASATKEDVSNVYLEAFERGIIGVTVYRRGSREGILVTQNDENNYIIEKPAPERPKSLPCHVYKIKVHGEDWRVFVGLMNSHPYEVFAGKVDLVDIPSNIEEGDLVKVKSETYRFEHKGEILIGDIRKLFEIGAQEALTRQISANLRHGTPVEYIIDQLQKSYGNIADFNKSILRALKRYMKQKVSRNLCPECKSELILKEGCEYCIQCSWSKCL